MNDDQVGADEAELTSDVHDVGLHFCVDHDFFVHGMPCNIFEHLLLSFSIEEFEEVFVGSPVEVVLVESDDFVDVSVLFLEFLVMAPALQGIPCAYEAGHFLIKFV